MFLEIATSIGALIGAALAAFVPTSGLAILFGIVLLYSAISAGDGGSEAGCVTRPPDRWAERLRLNGTYPLEDGRQEYSVCRVPLGFGIMMGAGALSGLLGIGSGAVKVLAMDRAMRLPFKVSTTTSNFMIGVTAAASAGVYLKRGYVDPGLAMPVMLGVLAGSIAGSRVLMKAKSDVLRLVFRGVLVVLAAEMLYSGITGRI
jgi:uncharacterized membrane protein YfcA